MTGTKGNSDFCFPETLNIEVEGKQNSLFPANSEKGPGNEFFSRGASH